MKRHDARGGSSSLRRFTPLLAVFVLSLAGFLLYRTLSRYSLDQIVASATEIPALRLGLAGAFAAASYLCLTGFDALAVRYADRPLPYRRVALASFVSLSIGHNIGFAALSSGAIRYRFYSRWGLGAGDVAKVILFCGLTVGLGLITLAGVALLLRPALAEEITGLQQPIVLGLGAACLGLAILYLALAAIVRRPLQIGKWSLHMPSLPLALGQIIIGPLNFAFVAACLYQTLAAVADVAYLGVASVYVIANMASLITHVPGGLGVIESVVLILIPHAEIIGALLVFRFVYFLVPLGLGCLALVLAELNQRGRKPARRRGASPERG